MAVAEPIPRPKDVFKVAQWKWGIDAGSPHWRQFFFNWIFLPFLGFSYKLGIPTPTERIIESDERGNTRVIHRWFEDEGTFDHEDQADAGCLDEHWGYTMLPHGRLMPPGSGQYGYTVFPRKKKGARKWARPRFPFVIKDRKQIEDTDKQWTECLAKLNQVLDRR
jgi:hypothetical protein